MIAADDIEIWTQAQVQSSATLDNSRAVVHALEVELELLQRRDRREVSDAEAARTRRRSAGQARRAS